jgi:heme A synthase
MRRKLRLVLITFAVVLGAWAVLFLLTENESTAPFVYAIF